MESITRDGHSGSAVASEAGMLQMRLVRAHTAEDAVNQTNAFLASGRPIVSVSHLQAAEGSWFATIVYRADQEATSAAS